MKKLILLACIGLMLMGAAACEEKAGVAMNAVTTAGIGQPVGTIQISKTPYGTLLTPNLKGLSPGIHGFHLHENPSCEPGEKDGKKVPALAAGGHYDPGKTGKHLGPYSAGHLGDLPALTVAADGTATLPVLAPRLKPEDFEGRSLMIHASGDNYSDIPAPLGGGGARVACGTIQ
ncbi:MAG: superoxide dismutase [Cu-Zn] SodC [Pseudomonadota bacterium]